MSDKVPGIPENAKGVIFHEAWTDTLLALGKMVVLWGRLEDSVRKIVLSQLNLTMPSGQAVLGHLDIKDLCAIAKDYGFATNGASPWWLRLESCLKIIDNELRLERNRMIHDIWIDGPAGVMRIDPAPKMKKTQDQMQRELRMNKPVLTSDEIEAFNLKIHAASGELFQLHFELISRPSHGRPPPRSPPRS